MTAPHRLRALLFGILGILLGTSTTLAAGQAAGQWTPLPNRPNALKFAPFGDMGTGDQPQYDIGKQMAAAHANFKFGLVIMLGDNLYGGQKPADFVKKF